MSSDSTSRQQFVRLCECGCGTPTLLRYRNGPPRRFIYGHHNRGVHNPRYKGEQHPPTGVNGQYVPMHTYTDKHGYVHCYVPTHPHAHSGYVSRHRLTMEQALGRYLEPGEVVHHRPDAPKDTADPAQLELFASNGEHRRLGHGRNGRWSRLHDSCSDCGTTTIPWAAKSLCRNCYVREKRRHPERTWGHSYPCCVECGTTSIYHAGHGLCHNCDMRARRPSRAK